MHTPSSWDEVLQECEKNMNQLEADKEYCFAKYEEIRNHMDLCLQNKDYQSLLDLSEYFKEYEDRPHLHITSETIRIITLLQFLSMELSIGKTPFVSSATDFDSFMEQYTLTIFALRRLELEPCDSAVAEAIDYLNSIPLSIYSAMIIIDSEYFENYEKLYWNLYSVMDSWSIADKIQWLEYLKKKNAGQQTLIELASLYLEINIPSKAYSCLGAIENPDGEIKDLMNLLEEKIEHE